MKLLFVALFVVAVSTSPLSSDWRVRYGQFARLGQFPFVASINGCSASIINSRTILTAGHCVCQNKPTSVQVGTLNKNGGASYPLNAAAQVLYPGYRCGTIGRADFAILKTTRDIVYNDNVQPITLASTAPADGTQITVSGYGEDENRRAGILKFATNTKAACRTYTGAVCQSMNPNTPYYGDSGGPLFINSDGKFVQVGVVSGGDFNNNQAVYANVAAVRAFIDKYS